MILVFFLDVTENGTGAICVRNQFATSGQRWFGTTRTRYSKEQTSNESPYVHHGQRGLMKLGEVWFLLIKTNKRH